MNGQETLVQRTKTRGCYECVQDTFLRLLNPTPRFIRLVQRCDPCTTLRMDPECVTCGSRLGEGAVFGCLYCVRYQFLESVEELWERFFDEIYPACNRLRLDPPAHISLYNRLYDASTRTRDLFTNEKSNQIHMRLLLIWVLVDQNVSHSVADDLVWAYEEARTRIKQIIRRTLELTQDAIPFAECSTIAPKQIKTICDYTNVELKRIHRQTLARLFRIAKRFDTDDAKVKYREWLLRMRREK